MQKLSIDISVVVYHNTPQQLRRLLDSLARQVGLQEVQLVVFIWNNDASSVSELDGIAERQLDLPFPVKWHHSLENLGFGMGHNGNASAGTGDYLWVLNPDARLEDSALSALLDAAQGDDQCAAWEMRQVPYEHPKAYDPATLTTEWCSGAGLLFRRKAFMQVGGFEPKIFLYGEDVDISWRLRAAGWVLRYIPQSVLVHETYEDVRQVKPLQMIEGVYAGLCLRARFGSWADIITGWAWWLVECILPQRFKGERLAMLIVLCRQLHEFQYFRRSGQKVRECGFQPHFSRWDYGLRREGAFYAFETPTPARIEGPLVSIIIRTHARPTVLRQALLSVVHQTYRPIEVVVIEDGAQTAESMVSSEFADRLNITYEATGEHVGRSAAGNLALSKASGEWLCFLDDDDMLFADHVEVLLSEALSHKVKAAYGLAWEVPTTVLSWEPYCYQEGAPVILNREPFSRIVLWQRNYLPIQCVLFHRSLYDRYGGFDETMDQLEDWHLWIRYTLEDDFILVERVTSKYHVPTQLVHWGQRQEKLSEAHEIALQKQDSLQTTLSPRQVVLMAQEYARRENVFALNRAQLSAMARSSPILGWLLYRLRIIAGYVSAWRKFCFTR